MCYGEGNTCKGQVNLQRLYKGGNMNFKLYLKLLWHAVASAIALFGLFNGNDALQINITVPISLSIQLKCWSYCPQFQYMLVWLEEGMSFILP